MTATALMKPCSAVTTAGTQDAMKSIIFSLAFLPAILTPVFPRMVNDIAQVPSLRAVTQMGPAAPCIPETELERSLTTLKSQLSGENLFEVKRSLLNNARRSSACRSQVIRALMKAMEQSANGPLNVLGGVTTETYSLWDNGTYLLGVLRATEAIDLLIANLGLTDGLSISLSHFPALDGVIEIGEPSIPKLQRMLSENHDPYKRKFAAFCIASIGGRSAKNALASALSRETDRCVKNLMSVSLEMFGNKRYPNQIPPEKKGDWNGLIYCVSE